MHENVYAKINANYANYTNYANYANYANNNNEINPKINPINCLTSNISPSKNIPINATQILLVKFHSILLIAILFVYFTEL